MYQADFIPPRGLSNPHVQTLLPRCLPGKRLVCDVEVLTLPDGDIVELSWAQPSPDSARAPLFILFHGLEGSVRSPYAQTLLRMAADRGWRSLLMHFRGCGRAPNRRLRSYHAGETADAYWLIGQLGRRYPNALKVAAGVSLGGNMLLKLAAEHDGDGLGLAGAIAISPPLDLSGSADAMNRGFARLYQRHMLRSLKRKTARLISEGRLKSLSTQRLVGIDTLRDFDNLVTAPLHGFASAEEYYQRASAGPLIGRIELPALILHARDDPLMPGSLFDRISPPSESVRVELARHGGHVGFIEQRNGLLGSWLSHRVGEQLDSWRFLVPGQRSRSTRAPFQPLV